MHAEAEHGQNLEPLQAGKLSVTNEQARSDGPAGPCANSVIALLWYLVCMYVCIS